jgi:predicted transposase YdaD
MPGIRNLRDSLTYQAIVEEGRVEGHAEGLVEGRVEEACELLLALGERRFGPPDERLRAALAGIPDPTRLHTLATRVLDVSSWNELLESE